MQVFKWVRKAERCEFKGVKGEAENGEDDDRGGGEAYETEAEAGQRRLTRGKAHDKGPVSFCLCSPASSLACF